MKKLLAFVILAYGVAFGSDLKWDSVYCECDDAVYATTIKAKSMQEAHDKLKKAKKVLDWTCSEAEWARDGTLIYVDLEKCSYKLEFLGTLPKQDYQYKGKCYDKDSQYKCDDEEWYARYEWSKDKKQLTITYSQSCGDDSYILFDLGNGTFKITNIIQRC